jgi:hypothetical protein
MTPNAKIAVALMLGVVALLLLFALGEGLRIPATVPAAPYVQGAIFLGGMGGYFMLCAFLLSRGDARPLRALWPIVVALNLPLIASVLLAFAVEPHKGAVLQVAGVSMLGVVCSVAGAALGSRARHP